MPSARAFEVVFSKEHTRDFAESLHIPVARGRRSRKGETAASILRDFTLPIVLKPLSSFSVANLYQKSVVRRVESMERLEAYLAGEFSSGQFVIEKIFPGKGVGVSLLANGGIVLDAFEHHRVHEPPGGGGSSYRISAPLQEELLDACRKFTAALDYTGVAMFEFRQNPATRRWILLEVNGRFWGSLPLAIAAGVDFPSRLYDLLVLGKLVTQSHYRYGIYSRSIGDDYWYYRFKLSESRRSFSSAWSLLTDTIRELGHVFRGIERIDTIALDDMRPAFHDGGALIRQPVERLWHAVLRRLPFFRFVQSRRIDRALQRYQYERPKKLLFVCKGNICRSPFAEALTRHLLPGVVCESAGTLPLLDRKPPREAIDCAKSFGVDIINHQSKLVTDDKVAGDVLIFAFDFENFAFLRAAYPDAVDRIFLIGSYGGHGTVSCEVSDPFGGSRSAYLASFEQIRSSVGALAERLRMVPTTAPNPHSQGRAG